MGHNHFFIEIQEVEKKFRKSVVNRKTSTILNVRFKMHLAYIYIYISILCVKNYYIL